MIAYESRPEEFQKKFKYDNAKLMCMQMCEEGLDASFFMGRDYQWEFTIWSGGQKAFSAGSYQGNFDELTTIYTSWCSGRG